MLVPFVIAALSLLSIGSISLLLAQPAYAAERPVYAPDIVAFPMNTTLDWRGLV